MLWKYMYMKSSKTCVKGILHWNLMLNFRKRKENAMLCDVSRGSRSELW